MTRAGLLLALAALLGCEGPAALGPQAAQCGGCHVERHAEWSQSRHARGAGSPVFVALLPRVEAAWGKTARARCEGCHAPGHVEGEAIGCATCHLAVGNREEANGGLVVRPDAAVAARAVAPAAPHATTQRAFFASASLCGTCHEVRGPGHLDEPTLTEFRASAQGAQEDSCTGCHLDEGHRFAALAPPFGAGPHEAARAAAAARALLAKALALEVDGATVRLTNVGAAHGVPTGMAALRDVWVDVRVTDAAGQTHDFPRVFELGARPERAGQPVALFTDADRIVSRSLAAGEQRAWRAPVPGAVRVEARLQARAIRAEALVALGLAELEAQVPLHLVTAVASD